MPCRYDPTPHELEQESKARREKLDSLTRMLCWVCKQTQAAVINQNQELAEWWKQHQEADRKREAEERAKKEKEDFKKNALKKLTPKERKALGL